MVKSDITSISHQFHIRRTQRKCIRIVILSYNLQYGPDFFLSDGSFSLIQTLDYSDVVKYICLNIVVLDSKTSLR